ncbi:MAG TPA: TcmI family type II polyketide cyclase [Pseudonocardiaceae bacterium]
MDRVLIVARMKEPDADTVANIWAESDATDLPALVGVRRRSLFQFHGLYFHLIEAEQPTGTEAQIEAVRAHPLFQDVNTKLANHVTAYDEETWRGPKDAMAHLFYSWQAPR